MCGFFGLVSGRPADIQAIDRGRALASLGHRGPDGSGEWEECEGPAGVLLQHSRLAILDVSEAGRQPMASPDGRYRLVFNGEIYNYRELRPELELLGHPFATGTDTEVLLAAFAEWGEGCLERLRGMFAFAIWDRVEGRLTLARDRLGIKPLYVRRLLTGIAFASEVRTLLEAGVAERRISRVGLESFLSFGSVWGSQSIIEGIEELPPGQLLTLQRSTLRQRAYWTLPPPEDRPPKRRTEEIIEEIRETLVEAVRLQLRSDVPLAVFLSAGIDSISIAALASQALGKPPGTFTVTFDGEGDEGPEAARAARAMGTEHREVRLTSAEVAAAIPRATEQMDQPSIDGANSWIVARAARQAGFKVALSGLGGDEVFAGYASFRRIGRLHAAGRLLAPGAWFLHQLARLPPASERQQRITKGLEALAGPWPVGSYAALRRLFLPGQLLRLLGVEPRGAFIRDEGLRGDPDEVNQLSRLELGNYLVGTLLRDTDVMSMAHGLEVRPPLLDEKLVELLVRLPGNLKLERGMNKPLLSRAALPKELLSLASRQKTGFTLPFATWEKGPLRDWVADGLNDAEALMPGCRAVAASTGWSRRLALVNLGQWSRHNRCRL